MENASYSNSDVYAEVARQLRACDVALDAERRGPEYDDAILLIRKAAEYVEGGAVDHGVAQGHLERAVEAATKLHSMVGKGATENVRDDDDFIESMNDAEEASKRRSSEDLAKMLATMMLYQTLRAINEASVFGDVRMSFGVESVDAEQVNSLRFGRSAFEMFEVFPLSPVGNMRSGITIEELTDVIGDGLTVRLASGGRVDELKRRIGTAWEEGVTVCGVKLSGTAFVNFVRVVPKLVGDAARRSTRTLASATVAMSVVLTVFHLWGADVTSIPDFAPGFGDIFWSFFSIDTLANFGSLLATCVHYISSLNPGFFGLMEMVPSWENIQNILLNFLEALGREFQDAADVWVHPVRTVRAGVTSWVPGMFALLTVMPEATMSTAPLVGYLAGASYAPDSWFTTVTVPALMSVYVARKIAVVANQIGKTREGKDKHVVVRVLQASKLLATGFARDILPHNIRQILLRRRPEEDRRSEEEKLQERPTRQRGAKKEERSDSFARCVQVMRGLALASLEFSAVVEFVRAAAFELLRRRPWRGEVQQQERRVLETLYFTRPPVPITRDLVDRVITSLRGRPETQHLERSGALRAAVEDAFFHVDASDVANMMESVNRHAREDVGPEVLAAVEEAEEFVQAFRDSQFGVGAAPQMNINMADGLQELNRLGDVFSVTKVRDVVFGTASERYGSAVRVHNAYKGLAEKFQARFSPFVMLQKRLVLEVSGVVGGYLPGPISKLLALGFSGFQKLQNVKDAIEFFHLSVKLIDELANWFEFDHSLEKASLWVAQAIGLLMGHLKTVVNAILTNSKLMGARDVNPGDLGRDDYWKVSDAMTKEDFDEVVTAFSRMRDFSDRTLTPLVDFTMNLVAVVENYSESRSKLAPLVYSTLRDFQAEVDGSGVTGSAWSTRMNQALGYMRLVGRPDGNTLVMSDVVADMVVREKTRVDRVVRSVLAAARVMRPGTLIKQRDAIELFSEFQANRKLIDGVEQRRQRIFDSSLFWGGMPLGAGSWVGVPWQVLNGPAVIDAKQFAGILSHFKRLVTSPDFEPERLIDISPWFAGEAISVGGMRVASPIKLQAPEEMLELAVRTLVKGTATNRGVIYGDFAYGSVSALVSGGDVQKFSGVIGYSDTEQARTSLQSQFRRDPSLVENLHAAITAQRVASAPDNLATTHGLVGIVSSIAALDSTVAGLILNTLTEYERFIADSRNMTIYESNLLKQAIRRFNRSDEANALSDHSRAALSELMNAALAAEKRKDLAAFWRRSGNNIALSLVALGGVLGGQAYGVLDLEAIGTLFSMVASAGGITWLLGSDFSDQAEKAGNLASDSTKSGAALNEYMRVLWLHLKLMALRVLRTVPQTLRALTASSWRFGAVTAATYLAVSRTLDFEGLFPFTSPVYMSDIMFVSGLASRALARWIATRLLVFTMDTVGEMSVVHFEQRGVGEVGVAGWMLFKFLSWSTVFGAQMQQSVANGDLSRVRRYIEFTALPAVSPSVSGDVTREHQVFQTVMNQFAALEGTRARSEANALFGRVMEGMNQGPRGDAPVAVLSALQDAIDNAKGPSTDLSALRSKPVREMLLLTYRGLFTREWVETAVSMGNQLFQRMARDVYQFVSLRGANLQQDDVELGFVSELLVATIPMGSMRTGLRQRTGANGGEEKSPMEEPSTQVSPSARLALQEAALNSDDRSLKNHLRWREFDLAYQGDDDAYCLRCLIKLMETEYSI